MLPDMPAPSWCGIDRCSPRLRYGAARHQPCCIWSHGARIRTRLHCSRRAHPPPGSASWRRPGGGRRRAAGPRPPDAPSPRGPLRPTLTVGAPTKAVSRVLVSPFRRSDRPGKAPDLDTTGAASKTPSRSSSASASAGSTAPRSHRRRQRVAGVLDLVRTVCLYGDHEGHERHCFEMVCTVHGRSPAAIE